MSAYETNLIRSSMSAAFKLVAILTVVLLLLAKARAQSALDGFDPGANSSVRSVALQADGGVIVGGDFTLLGGGSQGNTSRNHLGRLNPDGTLDSDFDPDANSNVRRVTVQANGGILVGGEFTTLEGGTPRAQIGRLNADGTLDGSFDPGTNGFVDVLVEQPDGKILVGGQFSILGGGVVGAIGRLNADGTLDASFSPGANGEVLALALQPDGKIVVGGTFTTFGGGATSRNHIARLNPDGTLDASFDPQADQSVRALALQADGKIVVGGEFLTLGGAPRARLARLNPDGSLDSFDPGASSFILSLVVQPDGRILVAGQFSTLGGGGQGNINRLNIGRLFPDGTVDSFNPGAGGGDVLEIAIAPDTKILVVGGFGGLSGKGRERIGRLQPDGTLDDNFDPGANNIVDALAVQPDGKILLGGQFTTLGGGGTGTTTRNHIGRLNPDGALDLSFDPNADFQLFALAVQPDGRIVAGGVFTTLGGVTHNHIARLNSDGSDDPGFSSGASNPVRALAVQADGKILAGGDFTTLGVAGEATRNFIGRLNADGTPDISFDPGANSTVFCLAVQPDGSILVGGNFLTLGGGGMGTTNRSHIGRLQSDGTVDLAFDPGADNIVFSLAVQADGKVLVGGQFTTLGGSARNNIGRLNPDGTLDDTFDPGANGFVSALALQADGSILVGGNFSTLGGGGTGTTARNTIGRLNPDGTIDFIFDPGTNGGVHALAVQADGKILVGGLFSTLGGGGTGITARNNIGRLTNTEAALQDLILDGTSTAIIWSRSITSPEVDRVTFELSTDAINYAALPNPARISNGWQLTGQNFPGQQNIFIRARGFYATGNNNGSGSIIETVRNAFIALAPVITSPMSATATLGQPFTYQITATNSPTGFNATGLPGGLMVNTSSGLISGTPSVTGTFLVNLSATNATGTGTAVLTLQVNPPAPVITSSLSATAIVTQPFTYQITATNSPTSFNATGLPTGLTVNTSTGLISGTPSLLGTFLVNLSATNAGGTGTATLAIDVTPPPPLIVSPLAATATVDQQFIYQIIATQSPTTYDATSLPAGLAIDTALGIISGIPSESGSMQVTLNASNAGGTGTAVLNLTVQPAPASGIRIISSASATGRVGNQFSFQVITSGATAAARLTATGLPPGLVLNQQTGLISGTPTVERSFSISLTVTDGSLTAMATLQLTFTSDSTIPVITSSTSASLTPGQPFSYQIIAPSSDPDDPITYFLIGTLPNGLTFNSVTGTISGTFLGVLGSRPSPQLSGGIVTNVQLGATNSHGTATIQFLFFLAPTGPQNISTRLAVGTDFDVLIGGFIITGNAPKKVLLRAIGPSLPVPGAIPDTTLELHSSTELLSSNDNWRDIQEQEIIDTTIPPTNELESAILAVLEPGAYTAIVSGKNNSTGVGLVEIYDLGTASLDVSSAAQLVNISTRGKVQTADNVMIGGFILSGSAANVLVRAIGPELTASGVAGALQDPTLELHNGTGALIASNDDWESNQKQEIIDTTVPPTDPRESAIVSSLAPGAYTAIVQGKNGTIGVALVEAYLLP